MQHDHVLKVKFWPIDPIPRGVCGQIICYHVAAFVILFNLICNMTVFWKSQILTYWSHLQGDGEGGSAGKIFATMLLHLWFSLIWYATWPCSEKVKFWLIDPISRGVGGWGGGSAGKIFATMLLHLWFSLIWYATWPCSEKVKFWPYDPISRGWGHGEGGVGGQNICYHVASFVILFNLICNMTMFWKLNFDLLTPS